MTANRRIEEIDILKALGIIFMVAGHAGAPFTHFIYLFHMAVFFIASGFFYRDQASDDPRSVIMQIRGRLRQLWIPFFVWNAIYVLLHNFFIRIHVYTDNEEILKYVSGKFIGTATPYSYMDILINIAKGVLFSSREQLFGASWFLRVLFMTALCYLAADFLIKKLLKNRVIPAQSVLSLIMLLFGYLCFKKGIVLFGIEQTASFYCLYHAGRCLRRYFYRERTGRDRKSFLLLLCGSFLLLCVFNRIGSIELGANSYENPVFLLVTSLTGWVFLYSLSFFLKFTVGIRRLLLLIGKRTVSIVILHFLAFKVIAAAAAAFYHVPPFCIAAFPSLYGDRGLWWLAYTIAGTGIPVTASLCYRKLQSIFQKQY